MTKLGLASPWLAAAGVPGLPARVLPLAAPSQSLLHTAATTTSPAPIRSYQPPCLPAPTPISMRSRIPPPQCSAPSPLVTQALRNNTAHWLPRHSKPTPPHGLCGSLGLQSSSRPSSQGWSFLLTQRSDRFIPHNALP